MAKATFNIIGAWYRKGGSNMLNMDGAVASVMKMPDGNYDACVSLQDGTTLANGTTITSKTLFNTPKDGKYWCEQAILTA